MKKQKKTHKYSDKAFMKKLKEYVRAKGADYLVDENITSIGVGFKVKDGKRTEEVSIQFTVGQKVQLEQLESLDSAAIPESVEIDGIAVSTDVLERNYKLAYRLVEDVALDQRKIRVDPIVPGVSISNDKGTAGTLGCIVYDKVDETPFMLSNWHVFQGDIGDLGDNIVQPGPHDDNRIDRNKAGTLVRSHLGHAGDCAIASIEGRGFSEEIHKLNTNVQKLGTPELMDKVIKSGRTTDVTHGIVVRVDVLVKLNYGRNTGVQEIGCFEIGVDPAHVPFDGEISKGGDSGSAWMIAENGKSTGIMAGLHFAGEGRNDPFEHALACYSSSVFNKLGIKTSKSRTIVARNSQGYDEHFLTEKVGVPVLNDPKDAVKVDRRISIDYTHFSLALHKKRKFPIWVAWNIDGSKIKRVSRRGINFKLDPRIPSKYQIDNELYRNNDLDRGHIARRVDLVWGSMTEARKANEDSFFYTNIAPQMDDFNQSSRGGVWGRLENALFADVQVDDLKVSIIGGPIFHANDRMYRGVQIPREYYKVIIYKEEGILKVKSFLLSQNLSDLEVLELDEFKVFEVSLLELEARTNFSFDSVLHEEADCGDELESLSERKIISSIEEINW